MQYELNPSSAFGEVVLDLIQSQYEGDYDAGIAAIMEATGYDEDTVVDVINGDVILQSPEILGLLMEAFPGASEQDEEIVMAVASGVEENDLDDLRAIVIDESAEQLIEAEDALDELEALDALDELETEAALDELDELEGDDVDMDFEEGGFAYPTYPDTTATFAAENAYLSSRVHDLEDYVASFAAEAQFSGKLDELAYTAFSMEEQGVLPPAYRRMLVGEFTNSEERLANFAAIAAHNNVDIPTMLFASEFALSILGEGSPFVEFSDLSVSNEMLDAAQFSANLDQVVAEDYSAIFNN